MTQSLRSRFRPEDHLVLYEGIDQDKCGSYRMSSIGKSIEDFLSLSTSLEELSVKKIQDILVGEEKGEIEWFSECHGALHSTAVLRRRAHAVKPIARKLAHSRLM